MCILKFHHYILYKLIVQKYINSLSLFYYSKPEEDNLDKIRMWKLLT